MREFEIQLLDLDNIDGLSSGINGNVDSAFRKIQRTHCGFFVWRIEGLNVISLPRDSYGTFYSNECYVIYASSQVNGAVTTDTVAREIKGTVEGHIHFWLGSETTPEKSGVAAYKTVELDGYLGGNSIQHRETQGNESPRFKSYFKQGTRVLKDDSSAHTVTPKLYKITGRSIPVRVQLHPISWSHFNSGEVFLLQTDCMIFVWLGRASKPIEKLHSVKISGDIKKETGINSIVFVDDGYEQTMSVDAKNEFQKYLSLDKRLVMPPNATEDEEEKQQKPSLRLYRCSENGGKYRVTEVKLGPLTHPDLESNDVFIVDCGLCGIWVWVGKRANDKERSEAMRNARGFVKKKKYPNNTKVTRAVEGHEPVEFKLLFHTWKDGEDKARRVVTQFDALSLQERPALAAETQLIDDGSGSLKIWMVTQKDLLELPKEKHGSFFSGNCYIILYNYKPVEIKHIVFCWLGLKAKQRDIHLAEEKIQEIDDELGGRTVLARVIEGREPAQFLQLFKGRMTRYNGECSDPFESGRKHLSNCLLRIEGSSTFSSRAIQVDCTATCLNSNHCFVLKKAKRYYIWCGSASTGDQKEMAKHFAGKDFEIILEGKEPDEFWSLLGGKKTVASQKLSNVHDSRKQARLFYCLDSGGMLKAEEIFNFQQNDLVPEEIILVDVLHTLFVWIGKYSNAAKAKFTLNLAMEFLKNDISGRDVCVPILLVKQELEPPNFTGLFKQWDNNCWKDYRCFEDIRKTVQGIEIVSQTISANPNVIVEDHFNKYDKYPIPVLKGPSDKLPSKVDPLVKELHLTHDDFVAVFNMHFSDFETLPRWKQQELKKNVGLF